VSCHEHNEEERVVDLIARLLTGANIALVSDAGTPLVSDPGHRLVRSALASGVEVVPIPGPSALLAALAASDLPVTQFTFAGFLPSRQSARKARLRELANYDSTLVFYEAPHRIRQALIDCLEVLGERQAVLARELTKLHEQFLRGPLSKISIELAEGTCRGEMVLLIGPPLEDNLEKPVTHSIAEDIERLMSAENLDRKAALKRIARARGITRSEAYRMMLAERSSKAT
jgi:16S rRNA (cytidine1402-2'-O)-methyltransferase